jgi:alanine racemase
MPFKNLLRIFTKPYKVLNWIELSQTALDYNYTLFSNLNPNLNIFPVLKSNAYGHGLTQITKMLLKHRPKYIVVDGYFEALEIRKISSTQTVLIMGTIEPSNYKNLKYNNFTYVIHDIESIEALGKLNRGIKIHLELNTGMNRHGIDPDDLQKYLTLLKSYPKLNLEGVMSHLADADNSNDDTYNQIQVEQFDSTLQKIHEFGFNPTFIHLAQSAGSLKINSKYANSLRLGLGLYGINPLEISDSKHNSLKNLKPVLALYSTITKIIDLKKGQKVSYNGIFEAKKDTKIGVIPLGYYEGLDRSLSNTGKVKIATNSQLSDKKLDMSHRAYTQCHPALDAGSNQTNNKDQPFFFPQIAGRICMNHTMLDLNNLSVSVGDKVTVYSDDNQDPNSIQTLWQNNNLFAYTTLIHLNDKIRRIIKN